MKKLLSGLLASTMIMSMGVATFAADETVEMTEAQNAIVTPYALGDHYLNIAADASHQDALLTGPKRTTLEPGVEYKFPVALLESENHVAVEDFKLDDYRFTYSKSNAAGIKTFEIKEDKQGMLNLHVEVKENYGTKETDVKYTIKMKAKNASVAEQYEVNQEVKFSYGYKSMSGEDVEWLDEGDTVEIDNANPVITASQFKAIAKANDYKNVTLSGANWNFTVNVTDETSKNMISNNAGVKDIFAKYSDQDFKFYNFPGNPSFAATGRVELDVEDIVDDFSNMYLYRYADGKIYKINAAFDSEENMLSFRTNKLNSFFVTDKEIEDGTVVGDNGEVTPPATEKPGTDKPNPGTGAPELA